MASSNNVESEKIIGKGQGISIGVPKEEGPLDSNGPPEECIVNKGFIGEEACRSLVDKTSSKKPSGDGPPKECIINGKFIGEDECKTLMEKKPGAQPLETEPQGKEAERGFLQRVIGWFRLLFD